MPIFRVAMFSLTCVLGAGAASAQSLQVKHIVEVRFAETEPKPGLIPVHVAGEARVVYLYAQVGLHDGDIRTASVVKGPNGEPAVQVRLRPSGVKKFNAMAVGRLPRLTAIIVRGHVISTPYMDGPMVDDLLDIWGAFTEDEASALARSLSKAR